MRGALRRVLWLLPTLLAISVGAFWLIAGARSDSLPLFFNPAPRNVRDLALAAAGRIASGGPEAAAAEGELVRLGGAALPHVLPQLDALAPEGRARVATALGPLAERMRVGGPEDFETPEGAVLFWNRFWQDRSLEFRPAVVRRAVRRYATRPSGLRRGDVLGLDTYALGELVAAMGNVASDADVPRVRRLARLCARVTGRPVEVPAGAAPERARETAQAWQRWWAEHHADYTTLEGTERLTAMVAETRYGRWAAGAARGGLGTDASGARVLDGLETRAPVTLWLVFTGLFVGWLFGALIGALAAALEDRLSGRLVQLAAVALAAVPAAALAVALAPAAGSASSAWAAALAMIAVALGLAATQQRVASADALRHESWRTAKAFGSDAWRSAVRSLRASTAATVALAPLQLPALGAAAFAAERALGLEGIGPATLRALVLHDEAWLMAVTLAGATLLSLGQIAGDALLAWLDPRVATTFARKQGVT